MADKEKKTEKVIEETTAEQNAIEEVLDVKETNQESVSEEKPEEVATDKSTAKAGKRSAKAVKEAEELAEKEERKAKIASGEVDSSTNADGETAAARGPVPITRTKLERRSKAYRKSVEAIDTNEKHDLKKAIAFTKTASTVKFDATVELHIRLGVDPKHADQNIRGSLVLPHGTGKTQRIAVFATGDNEAAAKKAGADIVGEADITKLLEAEKLDFDILIATPDVMAKLGKFAKLLGPKGLMPNPKSGTVTKDVAKAVSEAKAGRVEYRVDKQGIVHLAVGKVSFNDTDLADNIVAVVDSIKQARPSSLKSDYIVSIFLTSSMGPSIRVNL